MKQMKLTPIFPPDVKPHWPGVYMASSTHDGPGRISGERPKRAGYAKFDGEVWGCIYATKIEAETMPMDAFFATQSKYWRGVE